MAKASRKASRRQARSGAAASAKGASAKARKMKHAATAISDQLEARPDEVAAGKIKPVIAAGKTGLKGAPRRPVTRAWVLERLAENVKRAMQIEAVKLRGVPTGEFRYEGSVANRALELIGKELGLFVDRSESVNTHHVVSDEPLTQAQWEERYAGAR